jgi:hypothetical protein
MEDLTSRIEVLEKKIAEFEEECCSRKTASQRTRQIMLLEQVIEKVNILSNNSISMEAKHEAHQKYIYMAIGVFSTLQLIGVDDILKKIIGGG